MKKVTKSNYISSRAQQAIIKSNKIPLRSSCRSLTGLMKLLAACTKSAVRRGMVMNHKDHLCYTNTQEEQTKKRTCAAPYVGLKNFDLFFTEINLILTLEGSVS
jgi:hypothetical protein